MTDTTGTPPLARYLSQQYERIAYLATSEILFKHVRSPLQGPPQVWDLVARVKSDIGLSIAVEDQVVARARAVMLGGDVVADTAQSADYGRRLSGFAVDALLTAANAYVNDTAAPYLLGRPRHLIEAPPWSNGAREHVAVFDAFSALSLQMRTVLLGGPGSGKSTVLKAIATAQMGELCAPPKAGSPSQLGCWPSTPLTPVFVELSALVSSENFPPLGERVNADAFDDFVRSTIVNNDSAAWEALEADLAAGRAIILIDGLDEVSVPYDTPDGLGERRVQLQQLMSALSIRYSQTPIIVSSRPSGYSDWALEDFQVVRLRPLGPEEEQVLIRSVVSRLRTHIDDDDRMYVTRLLSELGSVPRALREQPMFLTLLVLLHVKKGGSLPNQRGSLIHEALDLLVGSWAEARLGGKTILEVLGCGADALMERLEAIAFRAHGESPEHGDDAATISLGMILEELYDLGVNPAQVLDFFSSHAGVLSSPAPKRYRFAHRLFQEYLAAAFLAHLRGEGGETVERAADLLSNDPVRWQEVVLFLGETLMGEHRTSELWELVFELFELSRDGARNVAATRSFLLWFCSRLIVDNELYQGPKRIYRNRIAEVRVALVEVLAVSELDPARRREVGIALAHLGDPRSGVGLNPESGTPDFAWVELASGVFTIGTSTDDVGLLSELAGGVDWDLDREMPDCSVEMTSLSVGLFPVTVAQFKAFLDAPDGYRSPEWWSEDGLRWRDGTVCLALEGEVLPTFPVRNVSWFECDAFARWLCSRTGALVRLLTEAEWEVACRGTSRTLFPWGDDIRPDRANVRESGILEVCPVGCFPPGWEGGPLDMLGNVWEWCSSAVESTSGEKFGYPYKVDTRESATLEGDWMIAVRGGYFRNAALVARPGFRGRDLRSHRSTRLGFRLCVGEPSTPEIPD